MCVPITGAKRETVGENRSTAYDSALFQHVKQRYFYETL